MIRVILGVVTGFLIWFVVATLGNLLVRILMPGYIAAEPALAFTLPMLLARLAVGALSSLAAGYACTYVTRRPHGPLYALCAVMMLLFLAVHYRLFANFPVWYHVVFLGTLAPLIFLGGVLRGRPARELIDAS